jgi:asparagine synthase (glutamine-hydrolysing)
MCGIAVVAGTSVLHDVGPMVSRLQHRGPDATGEWHDAATRITIGHTRLSIIDLSDSGRQPMTSADGRFVLAFNGEVYNHVELRAQLSEYPFRSRTDSEVVLAAWARWGEACLERLLGMFAFAIWDRHEQRLVAVRDRFGVKPLYFAQLAGGGVALASEIKALHVLGVPRVEDPIAWATYLATGIYDSGRRTFWSGIEAVPAGSVLEWRSGEAAVIRRWYDLAARVGVELDPRPEPVARDEYVSLLQDSVRLRFRSDVPVGINLSGGLDSSALLGLVHALQGADSDIKAFTFVTGDPSYDELPWVEQMLERSRHPLVVCALAADEVPALAETIAAAEDEPFGGIPTIAYAKVFSAARQAGVLVLLDGQGMDEQWAGYDYYRALGEAPIVQGTRDPAVRTDCIAPDFARTAESFSAVAPFPDRLRNLQYRDIVQTKLPRALRFNDRISMRWSTELREPFLDHRLVELALRQPPERKIEGDVGKRMLRDITAALVPEPLRLAPKRAVQTPQREWLRGPLRSWADARIRSAIASHRDWFDAAATDRAWREFLDGRGDNSFWVWQLLSVDLTSSRGAFS